MPAPAGNQNASKRVSEWILEAYSGLVAFGYVTRRQACEELGLFNARWLPKGPVKIGPPNPRHILARRRYIGPKQRRELAKKKCEELRRQIAQIRLRPVESTRHR
jgi:hypothetical protein